MHDMNESTDRTVAARALDGDTSPPSSTEPEWRPDDQPALAGGAGSGGTDAWSSPEAAPAADVVPGLGRPAADPRSFVGPEDTPSRGLRKPPVPSLAAIAGHPLHPMVVPLPIGALVGVLASDIAFAATGDKFWARASETLLGAGIATGAIAAVLGATDFTGRERVREHGEAWAHAGGNAAALALSAVNLAIRRGDAAAGALPTGLVLSAITGGILAITGWLGGELSYRHRIGVTAD